MEDTIRVRRIELIDEAGTTRAVLAAHVEGAVSALTVYDAEHTGRIASIGINEAGIPFLVLGTRDQGSLFASLTPEGPQVRLTNKDGEEELLGT